MTLKPRTKRALFLGLTIAALYSLWLAGQIVRFRSEQPGRPSGLGPPFEIKGVYHIHSNLSDGRKSPDKIAAVAAPQSLDFIILADHGNPNVASLAAQGRKGRLLVLAGSELSVSRGHLVALDFAPPTQPFSQNAEQAAAEVKASGGFSVIAHPFSKVRWSWGETPSCNALEIIDNDSMFKRNFVVALPYLPALLFKPRLYLLKTLERPAQSLRKWDELNGQRPVYGFFSADAHIFYAALLSCFRLHVFLEQPLAGEFETAKSQVFGALRLGRFYNAVDAARPAEGFHYWAEEGGEKFPMGITLPFRKASAVRLRASAPFPFAAETCLLRNGETIMRTKEKELSYSPDRPGAYRVEIYLQSWSPLAGDIPWIVSNPIFLRED
jgi:hypothetical protein